MIGSSGYAPGKRATVFNGCIMKAEAGLDHIIGPVDAFLAGINAGGYSSTIYIAAKVAGVCWGEDIQQ